MIAFQPIVSQRVFKRRALALAEDLRESFGADLQVDLNLDKPRRGTFECTLFKEDDSEVLVWTGIKKGPPRKLKFPESEEVVKAIKKALQ
ncbi:selenoprotein H-like [Mizuhopecten yessoensis]|uniref:selenoprotein H-like n=1 Tax=Mizuhopecten yessoensis TaxID=6573 RepID=UPI000B45ED00|nr:selenoprotein H-like [Mizuhopecten yessoensis]